MVVYLDRGEEYRFEVVKDESLVPIE